MCTCVISLYGMSCLNINTCHELSLRIRWYTLENMYAYTILLLCINYLDGLLIINQNTCIAYLTSHLAVERSLIENCFVNDAFLMLYFTVFYNMATVLCIIIADKCTDFCFVISICDNIPVSHFDLCCITCTGFLFLHFCIKACFVYCHAVLTTDQFCEI